MRIILVALVAAFCVFGSMSSVTAGSYQGGGSFVGTPSPVVTRLFAAFPNGGDGLMAAIRELLIRDPSLADDIAFVASRGNPGQQSAAAAGMAQAYTTLMERGNTAGAAVIVTAAQLSGNPVLQTALASAAGTSAGSASLYPSVNPTVLGSCDIGRVVSPTAPGNCR